MAPKGTPRRIHSIGLGGDQIPMTPYKEPTPTLTDVAGLAQQIEAAGGIEERPVHMPEMMKRQHERDDKFPRVEIREKILTALQGHHFLPAAAALAGVRVALVYDWIRHGNDDLEAGIESEHAQFAMDVEQAVAISTERALGVVREKSETANGEQLKAAITILEKRHGASGWGKTERVEVVNDHKPMVIQLTWPGQGGRELDVTDDQPALAPGDDEITEAEIVDTCPVCYQDGPKRAVGEAAALGLCIHPWHTEGYADVG